MPENKKYYVREIAREIAKSGGIPLEHQTAFEETLLRDVEHAVNRYRIGVARVVAGFVFHGSVSKVVHPAA